MINILEKINKGFAHYFGITILSYKKIRSTVITSTGRTGTNFFETFFNEINDEIYAVHEPTPDLNRIGIDKTENKISKNDAIKYISKKRKFQLAIVYNKKKKHYIECNPFLYQLLDEYKSVFIKARIIIIVRDPRTFVQSGLNKSPTSDNHIFFYDDLDESKRLLASNLPCDRYDKDWESFNRIQKISWYWNQANERLYNYYTEHKNHTLLVKFEDIFSKNERVKESEYKKILNFLDISFNESLLKKLLKISKSKKNRTVAQKFNKFSLWTEAEKNQLLEITKPMRDRLGY